MSSISLQGPRSTLQSSIAVQKSIADQGVNELFSLKNFYDKFLFPFYDELFRMVKLHTIFTVITVLVFIDQIIVSSTSFIQDKIEHFFTNFNAGLTYEEISIPIIYLVTNIAFFIYLFFNYRTKRIFNYWQLYLASVFLNFFNVIFFAPVCGVCGYSVYQLDNVINLHYSNNIYIKPGDQNQLGNYTIQSQENIGNRLFFNNTSKFSRFIYTIKNYNHKNKKNLNKNADTPFYSNKYKQKFKNLNLSNDINIINNNNNNQHQRSDNTNFGIKNPQPNQYEFNADDPNDPNDPDNPRDPSDPDDSDSSNSPFDYDNSEEERSLIILNRDFTQHTIILIFFLIEALIIYAQIVITYRFMSESPYLNRTNFGMWDCQVFIDCLLLLGANQFFFYFLKILPSWCMIFYQIVVLISIIYILYYTFFQPFIKVSMNTFFQSLLSAFFVATFLSFIYQLKKFLIIYFLIYFSLFFFLFFLIVYSFINKKIFKEVNKKLSPPSINTESTDESLKSSDSQSRKLKKKYSIIRSKDELSIDDVKHELNENEKREIFDSFVFQSIEHALLYLRVGVSRASPFFVDFSFMRYMKECYGQKPIQLFILQLSALFPSQHQFFNFCITTFCKKIEFFNMYENFIMYQIHRINIIRQSSASKEVQNELFRLEKMSDDSISAIRGFWSELLQAKTDFNSSSLGFIRKLSLSTKSNYIDAIEKFPNSQQILNSYCRFLCEACGDYIECARVGQKMRLIEQGKNSNADHCFHSFVNVFPHYLKKRILNVKGTFIMNSGSFSASQSSNSLSSDRLSASFDNARGMPLDINSNSNNHNFNYSSPLTIKKRNKDEFENLIEQEHFETLINNLFTNAKQRLSIQTIVDRSENVALSFSRWVSIVQFIISFVIIISTFAYVSSSSKTVSYMESATRISQISASLEYCSLVASIQYATEFFGKNMTEIMINKLNIREENLPNFACTFIYPIISLNSMKQNIIKLLNDEMKYIMSDPEDHVQELKIYTGLQLFNSDDDDYDYENYESGVFVFKFLYEYPFIINYILTVRNAVEFFQSTVERLSYEKSIYIIDHVMQYANEDSYVKHSNYTEKFKKQQQKIKELKLKSDERFIDFSNFFTTYLDLISNGLVLAGPFNKLFGVISENSIQLTKKYKLKIQLAAEACLIIFFIIFTFIRIYNLIIIKQLIKVLSIVIKRVNSSDIQEAMKPIYLKSKKGIKIHSANNHSIFEYSPTILIYSIIGFCSIVVFIGFYTISLYIFLESFKFIEDAFELSNKSSNRFLLITDLMNTLIADRIGVFDFNLSELFMRDTLDLLAHSEQIDMSIIGKIKSLDDFYFMINEEESFNFETFENQTNTTTHKSKSKYPFNLKKPKTTNDNYYYQKFVRNDFFNNKKCTSYDNSNESTQMNFATYLDCISIESKINMAIHYFLQLSYSIKDKHFAEIMDQPEFAAALFIIDKHLFQVMPEFQNQILYVTEDEIRKQRNVVYIIGTLCIVLSAILCIIELILIKNISFSYEAFKQLLMVLPPTAFTNNPFLINFLVSTYTKTRLFVKISNNSIINSIAKLSHHKNNIISDEDTLVNVTDHAIISTDKNLIIQYVNPAVSKMTVFPADQLLGQGLVYLIPLISKKSKSRMTLERSPFYQRLDEIRSNSGDRVAEVNTICIADKGNEIRVQATIVGIFEKKSKINQKDRKKIPLLKSKSLVDGGANNNNNNKVSNDSDSDTSANSSTITPSTTNNNARTLIGNNNNINDDDEEFVGCTIILYDISNELKQKKEVKEAKIKTEALINLLIPQPVLEQIRSSKKRQFYSVEKATLVKIEFCGLDEYIGSVMPKQLMTFLQNLYQKITDICEKNKKEEKVLFKGSKLSKDKKNINMSSKVNTNEDFQFNFNNIILSTDTEFSPRRNLDKNEHTTIDNTNKHQPRINNNSVDDDEINDDDENCDFTCVYNIRNDVDNFVSISGLFDSQNELNKQAESCLRYAMKVKQIIKNFELEEQFNLFIHARIVVCMGGPIDGIVDDPENPKLEIFSNLLNEADRIRDMADLDSVCINEEVYNYIVKDNYDIEERFDLENNQIGNGQKVFVVNRCSVNKKNENNVFIIND